MNKIVAEGSQPFDQIAKQNMSFLDYTDYGTDDCSCCLFGEVVVEQDLIIKYEQESDSSYAILWGKPEQLRKMDHSFPCGAPVWQPELADYSDSFIRLWYGCGAGCTGALFLPLDANLDPYMVNNYICSDLENGHVVSSGEGVSLTIQNLKKSSSFIVDL